MAMEIAEIEFQITGDIYRRSESSDLIYWEVITPNKNFLTLGIIDKKEKNMQHRCRFLEKYFEENSKMFRKYKK